MLLRGDTYSLYEYMRTLASQELNPMIIPPDILKMILHKIEEDIKSNARLKLCEDPETNIWSYYGTVKLTPSHFARLPNVNLDCSPGGPITSDGFIIKCITYPILHPVLNVHVQYELEGTYLATMMEGMFAYLYQLP